MAQPIVSFQDVSFSYRGADDKPRTALRHVSLDIEKGSFVAILGHNGSGKSTLCKHMNAILTPTEGKVLVNGMDTSDEDNLLAVRSTVGMVFQNPDNQIVASIVEDDVAFAPENMGVAPEEIRQKVDRCLRYMGMYDYRETSTHHLSGGQKQRVAIAGVLAMRPDVVVMDEPTAMLDPSGRQEVLKAIHEMRSLGITVVLITHHMSEGIRADRLLVMSEGEIVMDGTPKEIFPRREELKALGLGVPETVSLLLDLKEAGWDLPADALETEDCAEAIAACLRPGTGQPTPNT